MNASETQGKRLLMRMLSLLALAFILTAAGAWFATRYYSEQPAAHHASQTFFSQRFETADNSPLELSSLRGKVIVVN